MRAGEPLAYELVARGGVAGPGRGALERVLAEARGVEDVADNGHVPIGAGVAGRREPQALPVQRCARREERQSLEGLQGRPGEDRRIDVAEAVAHRAVGGEHHGDTHVAGLDEAAAFHEGELDGVGCGEGLRHRTSLPPGRSAPP